MLHPSFSPEFQNALRNALEVFSEDGGRRVATFDADGTLWKGDIGEALLRWLIAGQHLKDVDYSIDLYEDYENRVAINRTNGYIHAVALMQGLSEEQVKVWCRQFAYAWPNYRPEMKGLVDFVRGHGVDVRIVSASNRWIIAETAPYMGFKPEETLGISLEVKDHLLTSAPIHPVTCNAGKVEAIQKWVGFRPLMAFGDSLGDLEMLEYAQFPFVIGELGKPNAPLVKLAHERGWPVQLF